MNEGRGEFKIVSDSSRTRVRLEDTGYLSFINYLEFCIPINYQPSKKNKIKTNLN